MTYKDRAIKACKELQDKYLNPKNKYFFKHDYCSLCIIYYERWVNVCVGCPLANENKGIGCCFFDSYENVHTHYGWDGEERALKKRANFFKKIIPILKGIPAKKFTKRGWSYFKEL